jgi:hypothetical protein
LVSVVINQENMSLPGIIKIIFLMIWLCSETPAILDLISLKDGILFVDGIAYVIGSKVPLNRKYVKAI